MEIVVLYIGLGLVGLCLGSFAGATAWRLRARQLVEDKASGEEYDHEEYKNLKKLTESKLANDRSQCLHCSYVLKWYDLIPLVSWIALKGKCRNCHRSIGYLEPLIEISVALFFILSFALWPYSLQTGFEVARLVLWLISGVGLAMLFVYDLKWFLLPDRVNFAVIGIGVASAITIVLQADDIVSALGNVAGSITILSGIYFVLYKVSRGKWIGFGDIKLGLGLGLLLADFRLAFIALFAANLIGCILVIPPMIAGKLKRDSHVPFGPLLILGAIVAQFAGIYLIEMYFSSFL